MVMNGFSYVEYRYGVRATNSAAQVSTVLNAGRMPSSFRALRTASSVVVRSLAILRSEKPYSFASRSGWSRPLRASDRTAAPCSRSCRSISVICRI